MKKVPYGDGGWLELNEPGEITVKARRKLTAALGSAAGPMQRVDKATNVELAKLNLPDGVEPTMEQREKAQRDGEVEPPLTEDELDRMLTLEQVSLVATITAWSRDDTPNLETLENLPYSVYAPIQAAADPARQLIISSLSVDFEPVTAASESVTFDASLPFGNSTSSSGSG